jgi:hypothetical protein
MRAKRTFTVSTFLLCLIFNGILVAAFYYAAREILQTLQHLASPFVGKETADLGEDVRLAFANANSLITLAQERLAAVVFGGGGIITLLLWLFLLPVGFRAINKAQVHAAASLDSAPRGREPGEKREAPQPKPQFTQASPEAAVQILSIFQREGRLIDFLQEDLSIYEDSQIGAAVRSIHDGCKGALKQHVDLKHILTEGEGTEVTVPSGFDPRAIRLTGNVSGAPPFRGVLRHQGWRIVKVTLPQPTSERKEDWVLAPAEVEVGS